MAGRFDEGAWVGLAQALRAHNFSCSSPPITTTTSEVALFGEQTGQVLWISAAIVIFPVLCVLRG